MGVCAPVIESYELALRPAESLRYHASPGLNDTVIALISGSKYVVLVVEREVHVVGHLTSKVVSKAFVKNIWKYLVWDP